MKITSIVVIILIGVIAIACANLNCSNVVTSVNITPQTVAKWKEKAPQLFSNVGYSKLIKSGTINKNIPESQVELIGKITNPFGIRDDILDYIFENVPQNNEKLMQASIMYAQIDQNIYYGNLSQKEVIKINRKGVLLMSCIRNETNNFKITDGIEKLMRNNKQRDNHMWQVDRKYFSWQLVGSGLTAGEEYAICESEAF